MQLTILVSFFLAGVSLTAQVTRNVDIPLKNWSTPLYWLPSQGETAAGREGARIQTARPEALPTAPLVFVAMTPCRVVDTRVSQMFPDPFGPPSLSSGPARTFTIQTSTKCTIPSTAQAYSFNVTVVPPGPLGYLTIYPHGQNTPNAVTLDDFPTGDIRNNAAIVPAGTPNGAVDIVVNGNTDVVLDINGYYAGLNQTDLGNANTAIGVNALASNTTGPYNTATGWGALANNTTGSSNTASGTGALFFNTTGYNNTAYGYNALVTNTTGFNNTANGYQALLSNTTGIQNTASGHQALYGNTTGGSNTANGLQALFSNTTGSGNTAMGVAGLFNNTSGTNNTASGVGALFFNTTGGYNTAIGEQALRNNTSATWNTASGAEALFSNTTGVNNTASGYQSLYTNTTGFGNTASGAGALYNNTDGFYNTASGSGALKTNTSGVRNTAIGDGALSSSTGSSNTALGDGAGSNITTGNDNIEIGNLGKFGDDGVIRIGNSLRNTSFFAAGIRGVTTGNNDAMPIMIDSAGQLGTTSSSRRYKEDIQDMNCASSGLLRLRPVTYRYQQPYADGSKPIDYGLIAEEVAEVYPDLVVKNADGQIETVQYHKLVPMLLNELQRLQARVAALEKASDH